MLDDSLIRALPDLVLFVNRDGTIARELGSRRLGLALTGDLTGRNLAELWPADVATLLVKLVRRALRDRGTASAPFQSGGRHYEARIAAQGRDRALCIIRDAPAAESIETPGVRSTGRSDLERRDLFERLNRSIINANLTERPLAICMIHLHGLADLSAVLDFGIIDEMAARLMQSLGPLLNHTPAGFVGRWSDDQLLVVIERFKDRAVLEEFGVQAMALLARPVTFGDSTFSIGPSAGIAVLNDDGGDARNLIESARTALSEARRLGPARVQFYSDDLRVNSTARLDIERELRKAIEADQLGLRYAARHCLESGALRAVNTYLRWPHSVRGRVAAAEFLPIAESTGLAASLSRWALARLERDIPALRETVGHPLRFSFGALRAHLTCGTLAADIAGLITRSGLSPSDFELRVSERTLAGLADPGPLLREMTGLGISVMLDEFGRGVTSLPQLARLPVSALQLDRSLALSAKGDVVARRAAAAALAIARTLDFVPIAAGVDDESQRQLLQSLGCREGLGDAFGEILARPAATRAARTRHPARTNPV